jgi:nucleoside-diphosphate-sugar epimerase
MRVFLAGATGVIGRRLCVLLMDAGHQVVGTTRSSKKGVRQLTVQGVVALEREALQKSHTTGVVLRYGYFCGPGSWYEAAPKPPSVHVDAAAHAALLAISNGVGIYNIAENDGPVSSAKAIRELGFEPEFRLSEKVNQALSTFRSASSR